MNRRNDGREKNAKNAKPGFVYAAFFRGWLGGDLKQEH
jgi:hypothetical protein